MLHCVVRWWTWGPWLDTFESNIISRLTFICLHVYVGVPSRTALRHRGHLGVTGNSRRSKGTLRPFESFWPRSAYVCATLLGDGFGRTLHQAQNRKASCHFSSEPTRTRGRHAPSELGLREARHLDLRDDNWAGEDNGPSRVARFIAPLGRILPSTACSIV